MGKHRTHEEKQALLNRPCCVCKKPIAKLDPRQKVCSVECGFEGRRQKKVIIECVVCGASDERYRKDNLQWLNSQVNRAKGTMSQEAFILMCRRVAEWTR